MRTIRTQKDIDCIRRVRALAESYLAHVEDYFRQSRAAAADDAADDLSERVAILESGDDLRAVGMYREVGRWPTCFPEYVELHELGDGTVIYKIFVLHDNDCGTTFFTQAGIHDEEAEQWLKEQAEK